MRMIKFRAWHKKKRMLVRVIDLYLSDGTVHLPIETDVNDEYWWDSTTWELKDVELMQYTGLKDNNGTEIYEGDIVSYNSPFTDSERLMVVEWSKEDACFCFGSVRTDYATRYSKVIGNIYENPELLEGEE